MSFYIYLHSNAPSNQYNDQNNIFHFTNTLRKPVELDGDWEVALVELIYPHLLSDSGLFYFVYSNIVDFTFVGSKQYEILRPIFLKNHNEDRYESNIDRYTNPQYHKVIKNKFHSIEVQLASDLDEIASLKIGDIILALHFKKIEK